MVTRLKIDEELAKEPGTTLIMVGDTTIEVPLPKSRWEARDIHLKIMGMAADTFFPATDIPTELLLEAFCDQNFMDSGRNLDGILDECESIETITPGCDSSSTEGFCKFPEWVFCLRVPIPLDYEDDYLEVIAYDSMTIWKADEFPPGSDMYNDFENLSDIVDEVEMDLDSVMIISVNTDDSNQQKTNFAFNPNPFFDQLNIISDTKFRNTRLEIYNINGVLLSDTKLTDDKILSFGHLNAGYYIAVIKDKNTGERLHVSSLLKH